MATRFQQVVEQCAAGSHAGTLHFGEVVKALLGVGVESYHADYRVPSITYYLPSGETHRVAMPVPPTDIAVSFDAPALQSAIRGAQRGEVMFPEFMKRSMAAGCVGYIVWLAGQQVSYFGRHGAVHLEPFPSSS